MNVLMKKLKKFFTLKIPTKSALEMLNIQENFSTLYLPIKGFEDYYEISPLGHIRSKQRTIVDSLGRTVTKYPGDMSCYTKRDGHIAVTLSMHGNKYIKYVHRLVAECYVTNPDPQTHIFVRFKDGNKENIRWDNLEWTKQSCDADYITYKDKVNRKYGSKVNNEILDELLVKVLSKSLNVTQAALLVGYGSSYMSVCLRRRAKQLGLMDVWKQVISKGRYDKSPRQPNNKENIS